MKDWWNNLKKPVKIIIIAVVAFFAIGIIGAAAGVNPDENTNDATKTETATQEQKQEAQTNADGSIEVTKNGVAKGDFATKCQEDYITLKNLIPKTRKISLINTLDYNEKLWGIGTYNSDGDELYMIQWNGKDKDLDQKVTFTCYASAKDKDNIKIYQVWMGEQILDGILEEYNEKGEKIE